jgi:Sec-independent protein translocase protein TatA
MEILGVGPLELFFILLIALIVLGPNDMAKAGRTLGRFMRQVVKSPAWNAMRNISQELRVLPNRLMREAGIEEEEMKRMLDPKQIGRETGLDQLENEMRIDSREDISAWIETTPTILPTPSEPLQSPASNPPSAPSEPNQNPSPEKPVQ